METQRLVGDELGLHDKPRRLVDRLDLIAEGCDRALSEGHQATELTRTAWPAGETHSACRTRVPARRSRMRS